MVPCSSSVCVISLCLLLCIWWAPCCGQSCYSTAGESSCSYIDEQTCPSDSASECLEPWTTTPLPRMPTDGDPQVSWCDALEGGFGVPAPCSSSFVLPDDVSLDPIGPINATFYSVTPALFAVNVSWVHHSNPTQGYRLRITNRDSPSFNTIICLCIDNPNTTSIELFHEHFFEYNEEENFDLEFSVILEPQSLDGNEYMSKSQRDWPRSCLDILHTNSSCGLAKYPSPRNLSAYYDPSDNQTISLSWNYPLVPLPTAFYIGVYNVQGDLHSFLIENTSRETNVVVEMIEATPYVIIVVTPYLRCSGLADGKIGLGCGYSSFINPTPTMSTTTSSIPMPSSSSSLSTILPTTTPTISLPSSAPTAASQLDPKVTIGTSVAAGVSVILVLTVTISLVGVCYSKCKSRLPPPPPPPPHIPSHSVFVVYAPHAASERDILKYIVCRLEEYFHVVTSSDVARGDIVKLIEEQERKANAILLVCTEEFYQEWEKREARSPVIAAVQTLLSSAVVQERLDKYAILVLDDKSRISHIPDNHYLSNMGIYVLGKERDESVIENLYKFVTKQVLFQHEDRGRRETSTASVPSSLGSSDLKSQCTESVSIDLHLGSSVGSEDFSAIHGLDQFMSEKDVPTAPTQTRTLQPDSTGYSGQSEQEHHLLTLLQVPGPSPDIASLDSPSELP